MRRSITVGQLCRSAVRLLCVAGLTISAQAQVAPEDQTAQMSRLIAGHVSMARQRDGTYRAAVAAKEASWQAFQFSASALGLKVTASANGFYTDRTEESRTLAGSSEISRHFNSSLAAITARQPIYRKKESVGVDQAAVQFQSSEALAKSAEQALFGRVFMAWVEVLTARDLLQLSRFALEQAELIRQEMERRYRAGDVSIDQFGVEVSRQQQRQAEMLEATARVQLAEQALTDLVGPDAVVPPGFSLETAGPNPLPDVSAVQIARLVDEQNSELIAARHNEEAARLERERLNADHLPTVDLYATVSKGENDTASYIRDESRIGLQITVPLYTSGGISASVAQADAQYRRAQAQAQALAVRLKAQAVSAVSKVQTSLIKIDATRVHVEATALRAESTRRGFLAGNKTRGDFARAESEYLAARQRRADEMLEYASAWTTLVVTTAQIDPIFLGELSPPVNLPVRTAGSPLLVGSFHATGGGP